MTAMTKDPGLVAANSHAGSFDTVYPCHGFQATTLQSPLHPQTLYRAGDWNFDHTMQQIPLDGLPTRLTSTTDCSSNNSGDVVPVKQVSPSLTPYAAVHHNLGSSLAHNHLSRSPSMNSMASQEPCI